MGRGHWLLVVAAASTLACGGGSLLTRTRVVDGPWESFEDAKAAYDVIELGVTTSADLAAMGLHPTTSDASALVTYVEVESAFAPHRGLRIEAADPAVVRCVRAREACEVWRIDVSRRKRRRVGNALLDWTLFRRTSRTSSWRFEALILFDGGEVAYKLWSGEPHNVAMRDRIRPLGPVQNVFDSIKIGAVALVVARGTR
jgi:hypothetical protein